MKKQILGHLTQPIGDRYVVKIVDDEIPPEVIEMEFETLEYAISAGFPLPLPRIIQNSHKKYDTGIKMHINSWNRLLLISFIDGDQLESLSDISDKEQHRDKICLVKDPEKQALLAWGFDAWGQLLQSGQSELVWRRRISVRFIGDIKGRTDTTDPIFTILRILGLTIAWTNGIIEFD